MKNLDEDIIMEAFGIIYNRFPDLNRECDRNLIQELMYILRYFNVYLYSHAIEGIYPNYTITPDGRVFSILINEILNDLAKKKHKYPLSNRIRNKEEIKLAKDMLYDFHHTHKNIRLHDIVLVDYNIKNGKEIDNIQEEDLNDVLEFLQAIKRDKKHDYQRKRELL